MNTKYIRLLGYENGLKVIDFVNQNPINYAHITVGGVAIQYDENVLPWEEIETFIKSLKDRYEITTEPPYKVEQRIVQTLKEVGIIKKD